MMGERRVRQDALFYEFSLERHVPEKHLLRSIDRFVEFDGLRQELAPLYSETGRPSVDPELLIRMLIVGYCFGIRSERRLCEQVHLNLAYRWFCGLDLDHGAVGRCPLSRRGLAAAPGSAWRACGGFERSRRGGIRRGRQSGRVIAAGRASGSF